MRFTLSATRTSVMSAKLAQISAHARQHASCVHGVQISEALVASGGRPHRSPRFIIRPVAVVAAELAGGSPKARQRKALRREQVPMVFDRKLDSTFAYSFIVTDISAEAQTAVKAEYFHCQRAQIEERFKDAKLREALRHLPSGKTAANRLWLCRALLALTICVSACDISPAAAVTGRAPEDTPLRRHAKPPRHRFLCIPPGSCAPPARRRCASATGSRTSRSPPPPTTPRPRSQARNDGRLTAQKRSVSTAADLRHAISGSHIRTAATL
jgi:hypothetical protein